MFDLSGLTGLLKTRHKHLYLMGLVITVLVIVVFNVQAEQQRLQDQVANKADVSVIQGLTGTQKNSFDLTRDQFQLLSQVAATNTQRLEKLSEQDAKLAGILAQIQMNQHSQMVAIQEMVKSNSNEEKLVHATQSVRTENLEKQIEALNKRFDSVSMDIQRIQILQEQAVKKLPEVKDDK